MKGNNTKKGVSRREFLGLSALGLAGLTILPSWAINGVRIAPSDRVVIGFVGLGQQGLSDFTSFSTCPGVQVAAGCDVDSLKRERFKRRVEAWQKSQNVAPRCDQYEFYEELLERIASCIYTYGKIDRMLDWARTLLDQGEHLSALQVCKKALDAKGNSTAVLLTIGDVFRAMGQMEKACEAYENASRGSSTNLEPLRRLADIYKDLNNPRKRLAYLERLDQLAPFSVERKLAIGSIYVALNNMEQARKSFNQGMELAGREAMAQVGEVAFRVADAVAENDAEMAIAYWRKGLDAKGGMLNPDDMQALNRLGMSLRREGRWQEACEEYRKALKTMPDNGTLYYNMAMAFVDGKDFESARTAVLKALSLSPSLPRKSAGAAYNMAVIFAELKDNVHALPLLRVALELDPANTQAQALLDKLSADGAPAAPEGEAEA